MPLEIATNTGILPPNLTLSAPTPLATAPPSVPHALSNVPPPRNAESLYPPTKSNEKLPTTTNSAPAKQGDDGRTARVKQGDDGRRVSVRRELMKYVDWIPPHFTRKGLAPVIRSSVALFIGLILLLVQRTQLALGPGAFIVLIVGGIAPPSLPVTSVIEQVVVQSIVVISTWAWCSLGIFFAHLARQTQYTEAEFFAMVSAPFLNSGLSSTQITLLAEEEIITGKHLEPGSSAVLIVFLGIAMGALLWVRGRLAHGPGLISIFLAIILVSIALTSAPLFPYPYYGLSEIFVIPFFAQSAISLVCACVILPETVASNFLDRLVATLVPIQSIIAQQFPLFDSVQNLSSLKSSVALAESKFGSLQDLEVNLTREITYARVGGKDLSRVLDALRTVVATSSGFIGFFSTVDTRMHRTEEGTKLDGVDALVLHLGNRRPHSPTPESTTPHPVSSPLSRRVSIDDAERSGALDDSIESPPRLSRRKSFEHFSTRTTSIVEGASNRLERHASGLPSHDSDRKSRSKTRSTNHDSLLFSLMHNHHSSHESKPVGLSDISRYMHLQKLLHNPMDQENLESLLPLLASSSSELLDCSSAALEHLVKIFVRLGSTSATFRAFRGRAGQDLDAAQMEETGRVVEEFRIVLERFKMEKRLIVIEPFRSLFDHTLPPSDLPPSHSALYWSFSYQFALLSFASSLLRFLEVTSEIEKRRRRFRLFLPVWGKVQFGEDRANEDFDNEFVDDTSHPRNPDFFPSSQPSNIQVIATHFHRIVRFLTSPSFQFAVKGGIIVAALSVTAVATPASASFFYRNRGIWTIIICALTVTQYSGDTLLGFVNRLIGTLFGGIAGLLVWSIATARGGSASANPYALAGVCFVGFPLAIFARLYSPAATQVNIIFIATFALIVGYSWQNTTYPSLSSIGSGFEVAWRRFLGVGIGVFAATIGSAIIPPISTRKTTVRKSYGRILRLLGNQLCQVLSYSNSHDGPAPPSRVIVKNLDSLRRKITRTGVASNNVAYEFSLRGKWPSEQYEKLYRLELEIVDLLSQLHTVLCLLPGPWKTALLKRTQFSSRAFLGPFLSAFQLTSTGLIEKQPIPYFFGALLENYLQPTSLVAAGRRGYGYEVTLDDEADGLPVQVDAEDIGNLLYLKFSVAVSLSYSLVSKMDQVVLVVKELVGESYIVNGRVEEEEGLLFAQDDRSFSTATPRH